METDPEAPPPALAGVPTEIDPEATDVVPAPMDIPEGVPVYPMNTGDSESFPELLPDDHYEAVPPTVPVTGPIAKPGHLAEQAKASAAVRSGEISDTPSDEVIEAEWCRTSTAESALADEDVPTAESSQPALLCRLVR